ncbi:MAG: hypothetical protein LKJ69_01445 [Lactobacillus sp.]|nr:hypothetical protein [Lactobacillus sp.]MCI2032048.1 hypothetical protein [Lactobacillus sp.]
MPWEYKKIDKSLIRHVYEKVIKLRVPSIEAWVWIPRKLVQKNVRTGQIRIAVNPDWRYRGESLGEAVEMSGEKLLSELEKQKTYVDIPRVERFHRAPYIGTWEDVKVDDELKR